MDEDDVRQVEFLVRGPDCPSGDSMTQPVAA